MLRYSHPARHGQAPSLRRWPGSWRNTLSHYNQVRPFSLMLSGSRAHCRPIAIGNQKAQNSCFTCTCSVVAPANFNWSLVKFEVLENIVAEPVAVCTPQSMSPNFAISVLNSYLGPLRTPEAVARACLQPNDFWGPCWHQPARTRQWNCAIHLPLKSSTWEQVHLESKVDISSVKAQPVNFGISDCVLRW